eukprot:6189643-Pleurochrysis_carterae.AAC.1
MALRSRSEHADSIAQTGTFRCTKAARTGGSANAHAKILLNEKRIVKWAPCSWPRHRVQFHRAASGLGMSVALSRL